MVDPGKAAEICERLSHHLGSDAFSFVSKRVEQARQASDDSNLELWTEVARRLAWAGWDGADRARRNDASLWDFMQWIEYCRHSATEAERKAAAAPDLYRRDMISLARRWNDLALHTDLLRQALESTSAEQKADARAARTRRVTKSPKPSNDWRSHGSAPEEPARYYRAYWEDAHEGLYVVRCLAQGGFRYEDINPAHERATGLSREHLVGRAPDECLAPGVAEIVTAHYEACRLAGAPIHYVETLDLPAGRKVWQTTLVPVRAKDGKVEVLLGSCRDITEAMDAQRELAEVTDRLFEVQEEERRRIAAELHDSTAQHLVALSLGLAALRRGRANAETLDDMASELGEALREVRTLSYLLHPPTLAKDGLKKTLLSFVRGFGQRTGLSLSASVRGAVDGLPEQVQRALFRVAQEAISNAHRHSKARHIRVELRRGRTGVRLTVTDDGGRTGEAPLKIRDTGVGIPGMEARVQRLGGSFSFDTTTSGTRVSAYIPAGAS